MCVSVLRRLDDAGVLPGVVIVGSWCVLFYERYFNTTGYLDLLLDDTILVPFRSVSLRLPHPANFALHKLLISGRRHGDKAERDREQATKVMRALHRAGEDARLRRVFAALPTKWKAQIMRAIEIMGDAEGPGEIRDVLKITVKAMQSTRGGPLFNAFP